MYFFSKRLFLCFRLLNILLFTCISMCNITLNSHVEIGVGYLCSCLCVVLVHVSGIELRSSLGLSLLGGWLWLHQVWRQVRTMPGFFSNPHGCVAPPMEMRVGGDHQLPPKEVGGGLGETTSCHLKLPSDVWNPALGDCSVGAWIWVNPGREHPLPTRKWPKRFGGRTCQESHDFPAQKC